MSKKRVKAGRAMRHALAVGLWAFLLAAIAGVASQTLVKEITVIGIAFTVLVIVIIVGILFDIIGVAVATAREAPLHACNARRVNGAAQAIRLVRNAPRVASFCNDVVGDVSGTLSGAVGVTIVMQLFKTPSTLDALLATVAMTAVIAALVVGGKALGKPYAIEAGTTIILRCGKVLARIERLFPFAVLADPVRDDRRRRLRKLSTAGPGKVKTRKGRQKTV